MMGVNSQRVEQTSMTVRRYRVRRLTAFEWSSERSDRDQFISRAAAIFARTLVERYPQLSPDVQVRRVEGQPQLEFSATIYAESLADAKRRAIYRFEKALTSTVPIEGRPRRIVPPWGAIEVFSLDD